MFEKFTPCSVSIKIHVNKEYRFTNYIVWIVNNGINRFKV